MELENQCTFTVREIDNSLMFDRFIRTLEAYGMNVSCTYNGSSKSSAKVEVEFPQPSTAHTARTRWAGRRCKDVSYGAIIKFETVRNFLAWYDAGHTIEEGMAELDLTRSTFIRRVKKLRLRLQEHDERNARRIANGKEPLPDLQLRDIH